MGDAVEELGDEMARYVGFQRRRGNDGYTFADALRGHRRQCLANALDDGDEIWLNRVALLDSLAERRHVDLNGEPMVNEVVLARKRAAQAAVEAEAAQVQVLREWRERSRGGQ